MSNTEELSEMNSDRFHKLHLVESQPLQINGLPLSAPAYTKWTFEYFANIGSKVLINLADDPKKRGITSRRSTITQYIDMMKNDPECPYMSGWAYETDFKELSEDFELPSFHPKDFIDLLPKSLRFRRQWIFFGKEGLSSDLHVDCFDTNAWLMMIQGTKTFRCLSPVYKDLVKWDDSLFDEDLVEKLKKEGATVHEFKVSRGSMLYIPSGWIHHVRNDTDTIMVTGNFSSHNHVIRFYPNFRELIAKDAILCDRIFQEYIQSLKGQSFISVETEASLREHKKNIEGEMKYYQEILFIYNEFLSKTTQSVAG
ncbi:MAG: hypothetical protein A3I05_02380 [Deltaproteobacteria bacterium RIFCSPLOWO2_02_FULL_44_10]|nr:MAG: hypothetical protein A3I05_02380 [Deltaproteobacteria bacterium RIFCSPLOWO2_02_FULL_44_10]